MEDKIMYLEERLNGLDEKANVLVKLSSATVYGIGETDEPITMQDSCGNHYVKNWLGVIKDFGLEKKFVVLASNQKDDTLIVHLKNKKDEHIVDILDRMSNNYACRALFA